MGQSICRSARKKSLKEKSLKRARCLVLLPIIFFTIIDRPLLSSREWLYDFIMARLVLLLFLAFSPLHSVEWCSESIITNNSRVPIPIRPVNFAAYARCCVCLHEQSHKNIDTMTRVFFFLLLVRCSAPTSRAAVWLCLLAPWIEWFGSDSTRAFIKTINWLMIF